VVRIDHRDRRTPRSNPATYTGSSRHSRSFLDAAEARERGYKPGRFSFNVTGGRCEACQATASAALNDFMPMCTCSARCATPPLHQETLAVKFHGHSIADVLDLTIEDALRC